MATAQLTVELSSINTESLLEELSERLDSNFSYYRSKIKNWIKDVYTDLVYNDDLFFIEEISIIDKDKFDFFYKNYTNITLEQLETLIK